MAIHFEKIDIDQFRGIRRLKMDHLNHINIIAGDNNSGKTSVLEALLLLRNPLDLTNMFRVARLRDTNVYFNGISVFENVMNLFPQSVEAAEDREILLSGIYEGKDFQYHVCGKQKKVMMEPGDVMKKLDMSGRRNYSPFKKSDFMVVSDMMEVDSFSGELSYQSEGHRNRVEMDIDVYTSASGREIKRYNYINMEYLAPSQHVCGNTFGKIIKNDAYKNICLHVLRLFDSDIDDILLLKNEENNRSVEYIKHRKLGNMPLSTYGDGIKKVLSLANGIAKSAGGILLIDEVETAIHSKYYSDIFSFLVRASIQFDVQVYITTHSIEAIDGLLSTQRYDEQTSKDDISVITLKKEAGDSKTYSRALSGREVYNNREQFGFEVRL